MKLNKNFITHHSGNEYLLVPTGGADFSGLVRGNRTLGAVVELLKEDLTKEEIVAAMLRRFDAPEDLIAADVEKALS
ncbi:MAG: PqqD family protein, partial [Lachnospiraceae bacterium]|nr:PqqD family protein [Lachnospiraceae bacterium]